MEKKKLIFRMAARCEAAGRPNNEDNYQVSDNLTDNHWGFTADKELSLGDKGSLLVVCDGMGGMNAGEVASAIAVATIKEWFNQDKLTDKVLESSASIQKYLVDAIQAADAAIKAEGKANPEHEGMGSTIVMAWLLGQKVYVGWCGDSRAYRYNPKSGLMRLSHDHSYVQELVDAGKLTEELAFDHPNNNIITRSLGDSRGKAQPDTKEYNLCNEDIIMLCSDGLCGCLRDNEIEDVIKQHQTSMQECRDALWEADEAAGWHDNVTIVLTQIISGGAVVNEASSDQPISNSKAELIRKNHRLKMILGAIVALFILACAGYCYHRFAPAHEDNKETCNTDITNDDAQQEVTENVEANSTESNVQPYESSGKETRNPSNLDSNKKSPIFEIKPSSIELDSTEHQVPIDIRIENIDGEYECVIPDRIDWCRIKERKKNKLILEIEENYTKSRTTAISIKIGDKEKIILIQQKGRSTTGVKTDDSLKADSLTQDSIKNE